MPSISDSSVRTQLHQIAAQSRGITEKDVVSTVAQGIMKRFDAALTALSANPNANPPAGTSLVTTATSHADNPSAAAQAAGGIEIEISPAELTSLGSIAAYEFRDMVNLLRGEAGRHGLMVQVSESEKHVLIGEEEFLTNSSSPSYSPEGAQGTYLPPSSGPVSRPALGSI